MTEMKGESMVRRLTLFLVAACISFGAHASAVPEIYLGVWTLDKDASMRAIDAAGTSLTPEQKDRLVRGLTVDLKDLVMEITDSAMIYTIPGQSMRSSLTLEEEKDDRAVFSSTEAGTVTMHIDPEGHLNFKSSKDDDFDLFYFHRQSATAAKTETPSQNESVTFLDSLKTCSPGAFHLSYPGFGTYDNTIIGKTGDRCQVRIEHPQITLMCNYTEATIALLTSNAKYEEARNGVLSGSTDSEESRRAAEECAPE